ncbi:MAG TPA: hypothetical protein VHM64_16115 [Candidatus Binatia bacterium]|nr:hypothetical protein [Candidatus Binatia bacterium]
MRIQTTLFLRALVLGVLALAASAEAQTAPFARAITVYQDPG